ncbi:MAG: D-alanyl-D-alanine carboxypeptidase family protein [Candidatus Gottesmanbacteria bacterium]
MQNIRTIIKKIPRVITTRVDRWIILVAAVAFFLWYPGQNRYVVEQFAGIKKPAAIEIPIPAPYPVNKTGIVPGIEISARAVVVQDLTSGVYIFKRNSTERLSPASTTKILSALVVFDAMKLDDIVTVGPIKNNGQVMGLIEGERMTVENLLYGLLIQSGNDAGYALANAYPGGAEEFVVAMNKKAEELHLSVSHFTNPVGYDDPNHYMTAEDLSRLADVALSNKTVAKMVGIPQITVSDVTHTYFHKLSNVNQLLGKIPGVAGIKTGWTEEAGENLVTLIERNGRRVIIVVLKSADRFGDTIRLIDWTFANIEWQTYTLQEDNR